MPSSITIERLGEELYDVGKRIVTNYAGEMLATGGTAHLTSRTTETINKGQIPVKSIEDNAFYWMLLSYAEKKFMAGEGEISKKINVAFLNYLWEHIDPRIQANLLAKAKVSIRSNAAFMAVPDATLVAKSFLMIPMIAIYAEMWNHDKDQAAQNIKAFAGLELDEMYQTYAAVTAQPETRLDKFLRFLSPLLSKREEAMAAAELRFHGPNGNDGFLKQLKQKRRITRG